MEELKRGICSDTRKNRVAEVIDIKDISKAKYIGHLVEVTGSLTEKDRTSFIARTGVHMTCKPNTKSLMCQGCENLPEEGKEIDLDVYNSEVLTFINCKEREIKTMYKSYANVPAECKKAKFNKFTVNKNLYRCGIVPCIDYVSAEKKSTGETVDNMFSIHVSAVLFGDMETYENRDYRFIGVPHIDPSDGRLVFLVDEVIAIADDISSFKMTKARKKALSVYQCEHTPEAVRKQNAEILREKRVNHHRIFGFGRMEYFVDMVFHSVAAFTIRGAAHYRGWLDGAIIGDSRTGKSEICEQSISTYQMGYRVACGNISQAGLEGGMSQSSIKGGQYQLKWGLFPRLDRRLAVMDESHAEEAIKLWPKLNDMRASGLVKISKVGAADRTTKARVRKLFIANPPNGKTTRDYFSPVEMARELFTTPECIARLDFLYVPRLEDATDTSKEDKGRVVTCYYGKNSKMLLQFVYSRTADQVIFAPEAEAYLEEVADKLAKISDNIHIPLIQGNEAIFTLSRGCAAQAARVWSVDETCEKIVVHKAHCQVWVETLEANYRHDSTRYFDYSYNINKKIKFENSKEFYEVCTEMRAVFAGAEGLLKYLLEESKFNFRFMSDMFSVTDHSLKRINSGMIRYSLIDAKATNASFTKTRRGIAVFRYLLKTGTKGLLDEQKCKKWFDELSGI